MSEQRIIPSKQISKVQNDKKLIAFYDKLTAAPYDHYAQIHAAGEEVDGRRIHSLIGVELQDYSAGTGESNIVVRFNLDPDAIQYFLSVLKIAAQDFEWHFEKIFGKPDQEGYSSVQKFQITRHAYGNNGELLRYPWKIFIENGKGIKATSKTGGYYCKSQSYICDKKAFINISDLDLFSAFNRVESYIKAWEMIAAYDLIPNGLKMYQSYMQEIWERNYRTGYGKQDYPNAQEPMNYGYSADYQGYDPY